jgi:diaminopimelate decarboxylase
VHMHLGSQIADMEPLGRAIHALFGFAAAMRARYDWTMTEWSPGGGLGVPYRAGDPNPPIEDYIEGIAAAATRSAQEVGLPLPRMFVEPGRAMIARAVVAVYRVLATKTVEGVRRFVAVDGGMGDNIRPALYDARYDATTADRDAAPTETVTVVGRYCESGDVLLRDITLPPLEFGDILAVPMAGAYTLSMASNYNLVGRPALVLVRDGQDFVIQRRETLDDVMRRDEALPTDDRRPTTDDRR